MMPMLPVLTPMPPTSMSEVITKRMHKLNKDSVGDRVGSGGGSQQQLPKIQQQQHLTNEALLIHASRKNNGKAQSIEMIMFHQQLQQR